MGGDDEERGFREWYAKRALELGLDPDPDNPMHFYDYRGAYRAGATTEVIPEDGLPHWPSEFKKLGHPNLIVDGMDTRTMTPASDDLIRRNDNVYRNVVLMANKDRMWEHGDLRQMARRNVVRREGSDNLRGVIDGLLAVDRLWPPRP